MSTTPPPGPGAPGGQFQSVYGGGAAPQPQMAPPPPQQQMAPPPPQKKGLGPLAWVLIILGALFTLFVVIIVAAGLFFVHKAKQAGLDPSLIQRNPAIAVAKMAVAANPEYELVAEDDDKGTLTIREKKTGKTLTVNAGDIKNGKLTIKGDKNESVTFGTTGEGNNAGFEVKTADGTARFGAGPVNLPSWLPNYPGSKPEASASSDTNEGKSAVFAFKTDDASDKVIAFYKEAITSAGLKESANLTTGEMVMVAAADENQKRQLNVTITKENGANMVHVTFSDKK